MNKSPIYNNIYWSKPNILPTFDLGFISFWPSRFDDKSFLADCPWLWNNLPPGLWWPDLSFPMFRQKLKTLLFDCSAQWLYSFIDVLHKYCLCVYVSKLFLHPWCVCAYFMCNILLKLLMFSLYHQSHTLLESTARSLILQLFVNTSLLSDSTVSVWDWHCGLLLACATAMDCLLQLHSFLPSTTNRCRCIMRCRSLRICLELVSILSDALQGSLSFYVTSIIFLS